MADVDFAHVNLAYLLQARDLARQDAHACTLLLGIAEPLAHQLAGLSPASLVQIKDYRPPLVVPRPNGCWWDRLLRALADSDPNELQTILEHAGLLADDRFTTPNKGQRV